MRYEFASEQQDWSHKTRWRPLRKRCFANADIVKKSCGMYLFSFRDSRSINRSIPKPYASAKREWHGPAMVLPSQHRSSREMPTSKANEPFAMQYLMVVKYRNGSKATDLRWSFNVRLSPESDHKSGHARGCALLCHGALPLAAFPNAIGVIADIRPS